MTARTIIAWLGPVTLASLAACGGAGPQRTITPLRTACLDTQYWTGTSCAARGEVAANLATSKDALADANVEPAMAALDAVEKAQPLTHAANVALWEQRGIAAAFIDNVAVARAAFTKLLALDPGHFLSYDLSPKATRIFEAVRNTMQQHGAPGVELKWTNGQRIGSPIPVDVTVLADPQKFLHTATVFVRTRGDATWRAADLALPEPGGDRAIVLPAIGGSKPASLELYLRAYDEHGNEVLAWADPSRPREIPLRYDAPRPWWQKWWVITIAGSVAIAATSGIVYAATREPPDRVDGSAVRD